MSIVIPHPPYIHTQWALKVMDFFNAEVFGKATISMTVTNAPPAVALACTWEDDFLDKLDNPIAPSAASVVVPPPAPPTTPPVVTTPAPLLEPLSSKDIRVSYPVPPSPTPDQL
ncbi:hypothetical protein HYDPIDRAFT_31751 [Hydnomerulius pinastri MD-312]|uniref:Uncharacterized protein n=1 Tax=Hydnomerulius pinastri MD-312 TaxID=994086 RepID=A0A0C9V612_9AGAM|nr:hypothetical protein HYDPIDRAFT_31751 [Hydnomerulius pinastri MD-312]